MLNLPYAMIEKVFLWSVAHFECRESDVYDIIVLVTLLEQSINDVGDRIIYWWLYQPSPASM